MFIRFLGSITLLAVAAALSGCSSRPIRVIACLEASHSNSFQLGGCTFLCTRLVSDLQTGLDWLGLFRVDDRFRQLHVGPRPEHTEQFQAMLAKKVDDL